MWRAGSFMRRELRCGCEPHPEKYGSGFEQHRQAALSRFAVKTQRNSSGYFALLADADSLRSGDLEGCGNISEQVLIAQADCVLDTCLDPVRFMAGLVYEATVCNQGVRQEARRGQLKSDSPQGKVRFGLPQRALRLMFPPL